MNGKGSEYASGDPPDIETIEPLSAMAGSNIRVNSPAYSVEYILIENE